MHPETGCGGRDPGHGETKGLQPRTERLCATLQNHPLFAVPLSHAHGLECGRAGRNRQRHACQRARRGGCLHMPGKYTAGRQQAKARSGHATIPQMRPALSQVFSSRRKLRSRTSVIACQEYEAVGTPATGKKKRRWIKKRGCSNPQVVFTPCLLMKPSHLLVEAV